MLNNKKTGTRRKIALFGIFIIGLFSIVPDRAFAHDYCAGGCGYNLYEDAGEVRVDGIYSDSCPQPLGSYGPCIFDGGVSCGGVTGYGYHRYHCDFTTHPCSWEPSGTCVAHYTEEWGGVLCTGCDGGDPSCFLPGTQVSTPQGDKNIETLKPGDSVFSFNELTGKTILNTVEDSPVRTVSEYYIIRTRSGREIKTTAEHPFFTGITTNQLSTATPSNVPGFIKFLLTSH